jgi:hypothetical protein
MKGKGHEFTDVARLLNFYQLWLDGLYPRAKFADGLQLIEKAGHSKRMSVMRKEWIDEGKPGYIKPGTELVESILNSELPRAGSNGQPVRTMAADDADDAGMFFPSPTKKAPQDTGVGAEPDDDELDMLLAAQEGSPSRPHALKAAEDSGGEDDVDALLAEQDARQNTDKKPATAQPPDEENDDLDALLAEQEARTQPQQVSNPPEYKHEKSSSRPSSSHSGPIPRKQRLFDDTDSEGDDDLDALLAEQSDRRRQRKSTPPTSPSRSDADAPSLPEPPKSVEPSTDKDDSQNGNAKVFSSSPIRNSSQRDSFWATKTYSSSPLPNNPEEEDDLDALLAESGM